MNPYNSFLGTREPRQVIASTSGRLQELLDSLGADRTDKAPAPGKWSAREILCHLADCEIVFAFRLRQTLAEPHHVIQPFDQNAWAWNYGQLDGEAALETFSALRRWNVALIAGAPPEAYAKEVTHPERGTMTFQTLIETMAGHDLNHLRQLETLA